MRKATSPYRTLFFTLCIFISSSLLSMLTATQMHTVTSLLAANQPPTEIIPSPAAPDATASVVPATATATPMSEPPPEILTRDVLPALIINDTFQRPDQQFWGHSTNRVKWEDDGSDNPAFSIQDEQGKITGMDNGPTYVTHFHTAMILDIESTLTFSSTSFTDTKLGLQLRRVDSSTWYGVAINGNTLTIEECSEGQMVVLKSIPLTLNTDDTYIMRARAQQNVIAVKVWPQTEQEPENWQLFTEDDSIERGYGGIYTTLQKDEQLTITGYTASGLFFN